MRLDQFSIANLPKPKFAHIASPLDACVVPSNLGFPSFWVEAGGVPHRGELKLTRFIHFWVT